MSMLVRRNKVILLLVVVLFSFSIQAEQSAGLQQWLKVLRQDAIKVGIQPATLDQVLPLIELREKVLKVSKKSSQPEFKFTHTEYMRRVVSETRLSKGIKKYQQHQKLLAEVAKKYNVQKRFIVALWGIESNFGQLMGNHPLLSALATLAYEGRRKSFFRSELIAALHIVDKGYMEFDKLKGSWAGAMGQCQFMPSSYLNLAVDYDNDGKRDIWHNYKDVFGSIANYLAKNGWKGDERWGRRVQIPANFDPDLGDIKIQKTINEWQKLGIRQFDSSNLPRSELSASLLQIDEQHQYLVYHNFRVLLKWNRSYAFALAVGSLSDKIRGIKQ
jgi:membrane-bound lytic murein transglycosylase B